MSEEESHQGPQGCPDWETFNHKYYQPAAVYFERKLPKTLQQGTIKTNFEEEGSTWRNFYRCPARHNIDLRRTISDQIKPGMNGAGECDSK